MKVWGVSVTLKDGTRRWVAPTARVSTTPDNQTGVGAVIVFFRDVSDAELVTGQYIDRGITVDIVEVEVPDP